MVPLNLPPIRPQWRVDPRRGLTIRDPLRDKYVVLTPEEWVRQNFVAYLRDTLHYPAGLIANEIGVKLNGTSKRCDTVVFDSHAQPHIIVEYKAPSVNITPGVFEQIARYNMVLRARYLVVTNGLHHYCCRVDYDTHQTVFIPTLPPYSLD
ncbi:MAG: type I restriction enzyme HsdR N-terminal domain-containing protein [Muribaculaceae bacterium]|nr:type I restriction enzyme HsdR N-terminal domain-containing protein [Muribaculaceae bacterium]